MGVTVGVTKEYIWEGIYGNHVGEDYRAPLAIMSDGGLVCPRKSRVGADTCGPGLEYFMSGT